MNAAIQYANIYEVYNLDLTGIDIFWQNKIDKIDNNPKLLDSPKFD